MQEVKVHKVSLRWKCGLTSNADEVKLAGVGSESTITAVREVDLWGPPSARIAHVLLCEGCGFSRRHEEEK